MPLHDKKTAESVDEGFHEELEEKLGKQNFKQLVLK